MAVDLLRDPADEGAPLVAEQALGLLRGGLHEGGAHVQAADHLVRGHQEDRELAGEALGREHAPLGPGPDREGPVGHPPERRALHVDDRRHLRLPALGVPDRVDHVDRLAALGERHHQRAVGDEVLEVAELGPGGEGEPAPRDPGQEVLRGERGVAGGPAAHREDLARVAQHAGQPAHVRGPVGAEAPEHRRLLVDLLAEEVGVAGELGGGRLPLDVAHVGRDLGPGGRVEHPDGAVLDQRGLPVVQEGDPARVLQQRAVVGGQEVAAVAPAEHDGRAALGHREPAGLHVQHRHRVQPLELPEDRHDRGDQTVGPFRRAGEPVLQQVDDHLGVRLGFQAVAREIEGVAELAVVRDDPVVDEGQAAAAVEMRVGVRLGHPAVGGPAGVSHPDRARGQRDGRLADLADVPLQGHVAPARDRDPPRVVAAILELLEPAQDDARGVRAGAAASRDVPDVAEDSAHGRSLSPRADRGRTSRVTGRTEGSLIAGCCCPPARWVSFVSASPRWFAPPITTVPAEGPSAECLDRPLPRHPPEGGPGAVLDPGLPVAIPLSSLSCRSSSGVGSM